MTIRYRHHPELRLSVIEGEGVVLHLGTRRYFTVSETGVVILEALATPKTTEELVAVVMDRYDVTADRARASVEAFLDRCRQSELVSAEGGGDG